MNEFEPSLPAGQDRFAKTYPTYSAADEGLYNYWYPVCFGSDVPKGRSKELQLLGEKIALFRDSRTGRAKALHDRCPHRGVPLSMGEVMWPGTVTCLYHGWTYDMESGDLVAALTDGPGSPICGKANVRVTSYPTAERGGIVWVFVGDMEPPPPVERDIPAEMLADDVVIKGWFDTRPGNWRYGIENAVDEGHSKMLHRRSLWMRFRVVPGYVREVQMAKSESEPEWLLRHRGDAVLQDEYPGLGKWPPDAKPWQSSRWGSRGLAVRLPCISRIRHGGFTDFQWFVPHDADSYLQVTLAVGGGSFAERVRFNLRYFAYIRRVYQAKLLDEDAWMIRNMAIPPERLYRPDASITGWRRHVEEEARRQPEQMQAKIERRRGTSRQRQGQPETSGLK